MKVRLAVIIILSIVIGAVWMYNYQSFAIMKCEAENTWTHVQQIQEQRIENKNEDGAPAVESRGGTAREVSLEGEVDNKPSASPPSNQIEKIVDKVYILESSGGKNDSCKQKGKFNGFGYAQSTFSWVCYDSHEEVRNLVEKWFEKHLETKTLAQSLCYYNQGIPSGDCGYYKKFLALK